MTVVPQQAETEIVSGQIVGIVQKGTDDYGNPNKWQVEVATGGQNPRRLWTKDLSLVQALSQVVGTHQSFMCGISNWTANDGSPRRSLWINGVGQAPQAAAMAQPQAAPAVLPPAQQYPQQPVAMGVSPAPAPPQQVHVQPQAYPMGPLAPQPAQQPVAQVQPRYRDDLTEAKIHRQTATKVAVHLLKHLSPEHQTFDALIQLSERLVRYYDFGVQQHNPGPAQDGDPGGAPPADEWGDHPDSDIPF